MPAKLAIWVWKNGFRLAAEGKDQELRHEHPRDHRQGVDGGECHCGGFGGGHGVGKGERGAVERTAEEATDVEIVGFQHDSGECADDQEGHESNYRTVEEPIEALGSCEFAEEAFSAVEADCDEEHDDAEFAQQP